MTTMRLIRTGIWSLAVVGALALGLAPASAQNCGGQPSGNTVCASPAGGGGGFPAWRNLVPADLPNSIPWSKITGTPTTLAGYGITNARTLLVAPLTLYYRTDGNNACNGSVNAAGSSGNCAFADPQFCWNFVAANYDTGGQTVTCLAGEIVPKTFAPTAAGYVCSTTFTGGGSVVVAGNINQATVTTPVASPGVVNWTGHGLTAGSPVYFTVSGGSLPTGLSQTQLFYVIATGLTTNSFEVSTSVGGSAVNFTGTSSGTQTGNAITTLIDGTVNSGSGFAIIGGGCSVTFKNFQIKANINSISCLAGPSGPGGFFWSNIIWLGTTLGNDIFAGTSCNATINGTEWIASQIGSNSHLETDGHSEIRCSGCKINVSANLAYGTATTSFVYSGFGGRITFTAVPTINLNGFSVTGQRCYADTNGIVEAAGLGATFFPGNANCGAATGGVVVQ